MLLLVLTALLAFLLTLDLSAAARFLLVLVGAALGLPSSWCCSPCW
ncbi:hypothetical protein KGD82_01660 [Nocardiopsis eucommiae]|uniref:Uncharacterized protein n=1 Tax=Nocardiopsis eucommiae TaxID=2831970 RepID=A0A975LA93_9ACTN|nr:hypothetical protein KGD82_01660 [Nocardiopsis eucommiae]